MTRLTAFCDLREVLLNDGLLMVMGSNPSTVVLEAVDEVLPSSMIDPKVEKTSVGISIFEVGNSRASSLPCTLNNGQGQHLLHNKLF